MGQATSRRLLNPVIGLAVVGAFATVVSGIPQAGAGNFSLNSSDPPKQIWTGPATSRVGARVRVTAGTAQVQSSSGNLGQVSANNSCVFEGEYASMSVKAMMDGTTGDWMNRAPINGDTDPADRLIGDGAVNLPSAGSSFAFYGAQSATSRLAVITVLQGSDPVTIGSPAVTLEAGDSAFVSNSVTRYSVTGRVNFNFSIFDVIAGCGPYSGNARGQTAGESDGLSVDGSKNLSITLTNNGPGNVTVHSQLSGGSMTTTMLTTTAPSNTMTCSGTSTMFNWTYEQQNASVAWSARGN